MFDPRIATGPGQRTILTDKDRTWQTLRLVWNSQAQGPRRVRNRKRGSTPKANAIRARTAGR